MTQTFLLYGATGYTGRLAAYAAVRQGLRPILAGRDPGKIAALAGELGCWRSPASRGGMIRSPRQTDTPDVRPRRFDRSRDVIIMPPSY